jgi:hypothetical protein
MPVPETMIVLLHTTDNEYRCTNASISSCTIGNISSYTNVSTSNTSCLLAIENNNNCMYVSDSCSTIACDNNDCDSESKSSSYNDSDSDTVPILVTIVVVTAVALASVSNKCCTYTFIVLSHATEQ